MTTTSNVLARILLIGLMAAPLAAGAQEAAEATAETVQAEAAEDAAAAAKPLDRIAAVVNRDVITEFDLQNRVHQAALNLRRQDITLPPMEVLRSQVLDRLITEKAIMQRAKETGIRIDEQIVSASIEQIARNNRLTMEQLRDRLKDEGVTFSAFRSQIRDELTWQRLREREVDSRINIPESEIDAFIAEQAQLPAGETDEYRLLHIMLPLPADRERQQAVRKTADSIYEKAVNGDDFSSLAAAYSAGQTAEQGGDIGWRDASRMPSFFLDEIRQNPHEGAIFMVEADEALHIVKIAGRREGIRAQFQGKPVEQTHVRHILMFPSDAMPEAQIIRRLHDIRRRLLEGDGDFATYARLNSNDNSATRGGDLGWVQAGDMVPEFESVMSALKPGELSMPVKSRFGLHLIEVLERRTQAADSSRSRFAARQALREKKLGEAVDRWQRELHDSAYVEIRSYEQ